MPSSQRQQRATGARSRRWFAPLAAVALAAVLGIPVVGTLGAPSVSAQPAGGGAQEPPAEEGFRGGENPRSNYWGAVREGQSGTTTVKGTETGVLIQNYGEIYRQIRNGPLTTYGSWLMGLMVLALGGFYLIKGTIRIHEGRSGRLVPRFSELERYLHWSVAVLFIVLSVTGLILLFGRASLIPVVGMQGFSAMASLSKTVHNFLGPLFVIALVLMIAVFIRDNFPDRGDIGWIRQMLGRTEKPEIGRFNLGEKGWFWMAAVAGLVVSITGLIMDFTIFGQTRFVLQVSQILHGIGALLMIVGSFGHIYMGTIGLEGSFEGMATGYVDENWAKEHHDAWYEEKVQEGQVGVEPEGPSPTQGAS